MRRGDSAPAAYAGSSSPLGGVALARATVQAGVQTHRAPKPIRSPVERGGLQGPLLPAWGGIVG